MDEETFQQLMNDPSLFKTEDFNKTFDEIFKPRISAKTAESAIKMVNTELARQIMEHRQGGSE